MSNDLEKIFESLITYQEEIVYNCALNIIPTITREDLLQPNDYPSLENNPYFRYEEGVLAGLLSARTAFRAKNYSKE
ncbi:MAG: hypothetical protein BGO10_05270 [Chlamydia sp. 32-24]|nr:MAG: hypothetical protein BGO10_05270 [Chlamydia sp. 32-24]